MAALSLFRSVRPGKRSTDASGGEGPPDTRDAPSRLAVAERLRSVIDPEVGLNVVALGLIYDLQIEGGEATVRLTMTTPACPMSGYIKREVGRVVKRTPGLRRGVVELVWDPPWSPHMIEPEAGAALFGWRRPGTY